MGLLEQLVITLREGVEAALIVAIALTYLRKIQRTDLNRVVYYALGGAVAVSMAAAVLMTRLNLSDDRFEGWVMLVAGIFVSSMVFWMARAGKTMKREIEARMANVSATGLFLLIFFMVLREGVETVLMLTAIALNTTAVLAWLGSVIGLGLALLFAVAFVKGSIKVPLGSFFRITSAILAVIAAQLFISGFHELAEAGVLPSSRAEMALIGPIVRNDVFFFVVILGLTALLLLRERFALRPASAIPADASPAQKRRIAADNRRQRLWSMAAFVGSFAILLLIGAEFAYARSVRAVTPAEPVRPLLGIVRIPLSQVSDGKFHRFVAQAGNQRIHFFAIRRPNGTIAVALDACAICGSLGYYQQGGQVHCRNCDAPVNTGSIGMKGGCNPIPLTYQQQDDALEVTITALAQASRTIASNGGANQGH